MASTEVPTGCWSVWPSAWLSQLRCRCVITRLLLWTGHCFMFICELYKLSSPAVNPCPKPRRRKSISPVRPKVPATLATNIPGFSFISFWGVSLFLCVQPHLHKLLDLGSTISYWKPLPHRPPKGFLCGLSASSITSDAWILSHLKPSFIFNMTFSCPPENILGPSIDSHYSSVSLCPKECIWPPNLKTKQNKTSFLAFLVAIYKL